MEASGLARSTTSFRRQGSSGLVWDDKVLRGELNQNNEKDSEISHGNMQRSRSAGGVMYKAMKVSSPPIVEPPSPKVSGCGLCGIFGNQVSTTNTTRHQRKSRKR